LSIFPENEFPLWEIKLENGKILTEARYRFDVLTESEVSNDPGNSDSPPTVPEELIPVTMGCKMI
jgi:hypothetical protein